LWLGVGGRCRHTVYPQRLRAWRDAAINLDRLSAAINLSITRLSNLLCSGAYALNWCNPHNMVKSVSYAMTIRKKFGKLLNDPRPESFVIGYSDNHAFLSFPVMPISMVNVNR